MTAEPPTGKFSRALSGGRTAARVGGRMLTYYAKRPFLSFDGQRRARQRAAREGAQTLLEGLSLLRGTALKMAQHLSMETDLLPEAACRELAKAYHQVPPINRALVRKVVHEALGQPPEALFKRFDLEAFAAASLGQVHYAFSEQDGSLAVKIQYPGIVRTIESDLALLLRLLRPLVQSDQLMPTLEEVVLRLREEVDYLQEAELLRYFAAHLNMERIKIPAVSAALTAPTVLSTTLMPGKPLDLWLADNPGQAARDLVARRLNELVIKGLYELQVIHADPNPGNFIIADDLTIGLVDFGCIKRLDAYFVAQYQELARTAAHHETGAHFHGLRRHFSVNPEFIFLDRTRYGLWRSSNPWGPGWSSATPTNGDGEMEQVFENPELKPFLRGADYTDLKSIEAGVSLRAFIAGMLSYYPWWLVALYRIREILVRLLGLVKHDAPEKLPRFRSREISFTPGDRASFFIVREAREEKFWISETPEDRHLTAFFGVTAGESGTGKTRFEVFTAIRYRHWTGPVYFNLIRPFHHLVLWRMMKAGSTYEDSHCRNA